MSLIIILVLLIFYCYSNVCLGEVTAYLLTRNLAPLPDKAGLTRFASRFLLGQGFLASIWIIAGLLAVFTPAFIMVTLVICILITIPFRLTFTPIISVLQHLKRILTDLSRESVGWKIIAVLVPIV